MSKMGEFYETEQEDDEQWIYEMHIMEDKEDKEDD